MKNLIKKYPIFSILITGLFLRILAAIYFGDTELQNEWAVLFHNYKISGTYGFNVVLGDFFAMPKFANSNEAVLPSAFMPPLYFFLFT